MRVTVTFALLLLAGCARSAVLPIAADTIQITTSAAVVCGATGAQNVAFRRAAIETINRGYDRFIIVGAAAQNNVRVVGTTPVVASSSGSINGTIYGDSLTGTTHSTTVVSGGQPIYGGSHDEVLVVKMMHEGDPQSVNAVSARDELGPEWQTLAAESTRTTCR